MPDYSNALTRKIWEKVGEHPSVVDWGAIGDGASHPLSERYSSLAQAQVVYPHAQALTDEVDWCALQGAINSIQAQVHDDAYARRILIPSGRYILNRTVQWMSGTLEAEFPYICAQFIWNGNAGEPMIQKVHGHAGNGSWSKLSGVSMLAGTAEPSRFIDFQTYIDNFLVLSMCHFSGCTENALHIGDGWVNCFLDRLRFDNVGGYAIYAVVGYPITGGGQNGSSFILREFTYDHRRTTNPGKGVICFDNSIRNQSNAGIAHIHGGRIEVNEDWAAPKAIVTLKLNDAPKSAGFLGLKLSDIYYQDCTAMADDVVIYRDTTNLTGVESVIFENCRFEGPSALLAGTWPATWPIPPVPVDGRLTYLANFGGTSTWVGEPIDFLARTATDAVLRSYLAGEVDNRLKITGDGKLSWGNGTDAVDLNLYRKSAGILTSDHILELLTLRLTNRSAGQVTFIDSNKNVIGDNSFLWDNTNKRLYAPFLGIAAASGHPGTRVIGGLGSHQFWKDSTPTKGASLGMSTPTGGAITDNFYLTLFDGSAWKDFLTILNGTNSVGIGRANTSPDCTLDVSDRSASGVTKLKVRAGASQIGTPLVELQNNSAGIISGLYGGTGSPEGAVTATVGSVYFRTDGSSSSTLYVKETGTGNTGWQSVGSTAGGTASGDLSGTYPSPIVVKIQGRVVDSTAPTDGQIYKWDNTNSKWVPVSLQTSDVSGLETAAVWTSKAEGCFTNEVNMGMLSSGILKHTVAGGVSGPTTATPGVDYYAPGSTDVAVADGGTGASDAATARSNLGLGGGLTTTRSAVVSLTITTVTLQYKDWAGNNLSATVVNGVGYSTTNNFYTNGVLTG